MKTIRTVLLTFILLGAIMPAMAQVNFTEKTPFVTGNEYNNTDSHSDIVTSIFLNNTIKGITLSSSNNRLLCGSAETQTPRTWRWYDNSCNASATSVDNNYFQINSSEKPIKYLSVRISLTKTKRILVVGWKGVVANTADYSTSSEITKSSGYGWTTFDLSSWEGVKTIRLYCGLSSGAGLIVDEKPISMGMTSNGGVDIYGIQVGLSSNTASISTYGFAAYSSTSALDFTNVTDCNAYYADSYAGGVLHLTKATGVVPANFGLLLCATKGKTTPVCIPVATAEQAKACSLKSSNNAFEATSTATYTAASATDAFALGVKNGNAGFYYVGAGVTIPQNRMYLPASKVARAKSVILDFGGIDPTGIVSVSDDAATSAPSQRPATDLLGRPCPNPAPGQMYIKDGKVRVK